MEERYFKKHRRERGENLEEREREMKNRGRKSGK